MNLRQLTYCLVTLIGLATSAFAQRLTIVSPKEGSVSLMTRQAVIVEGRPGLKIILRANGVPVDTGVVRVDGIQDFIGVPVRVGDVTFSVVATDGSGAVDSVRIHIAGEPSSIIMNVNAADFRADGKSLTHFELIVKDKFGVVIPSSYVISIKSDTGSIVSADVDPNQEGIQRTIENGKVGFDLQSPSQSAVAKIRAFWGSVKAEKEIEFGTPVEPLMVVGSANGSVSSTSAGVGNSFSDSSFSLLKNQSSLASGVHTDGRLAFYGRGSVWSNYLLTASYDNERMQRDQFFKELDPDVLYSVYGDNSSVDYTAQTSSPLFVKLERNRSHILFGDFSTSFGQNELARYDRTFTGVKSHLELNHDKADAFATVTDRKVVQKEIRGQGISGFYFLGNSNVVNGSEKVRIEVRDKRHPEVVLNRLEKSRINDYEIDYQQGTLFFKQPVPSIDNAGNPFTIVVAYESQSGFPTNYVAGVQGEKEFTNGFVVGATAVTEERDPNNYTLLGVNSRYSVGTSLKALGEVAQGQIGSKRGAAWKLELGGSPVAQLDMKSYYRKVEAGFVNPTVGSGGLSDGLGGTSTERYGVGGTYDGFASTKFGAEYYHTAQNGGTAAVKTNSISGSIERSFADIINTTVRIENARYQSIAADTLPSDKKQSTLINGKATIKATNRINVTGEYERSISSSSKEAIKPSVGTIGVDYRIIDPVTLSLQQKFYSGSGSSSIVGLSSALGYGTSVTGKYEIANGIGGKRNQASIGLKNTTKITEELTSELLYEKTRDLNRNVLETSTPDHDAFSAGLEYLPKSSYKATVKGELAKDGQSMKHNFVFGGDVRIARDFTLIDKFSYYEESRSQAQSPVNGFVGGTLTADPADQIGSTLSGGTLKKFHNVLGLAYRPVSWDWLNAIGKYEQKAEYNGMVAPEVQYSASIVSIHTFIEPVRRLEVGVKYAMKFATERAYGLSAKTFTDLYLVRAEYDLNWNKFDVAAEYRILSQREAKDQKIGYSAEIGYVALQNVHVGVGYNFIGNKDRDLIDYNYWSKGVYVTMRVKFTEKLLNYFQ